MAFKARQFKLALIIFTFVQLVASNPIDLDPLGLFSSSDDSSASASANSISDGSSLSNGLGGKDQLSSSLNAGTAGSFAVDKNIHIPDPITGSGGLDADLALAGAKSFSLSKSKGTPVINPPDVILILPTPSPPGISPVEPPPPYYPPKPYYRNNYQPHGKYNVHDPGSRSGHY